MNSNQWWFRGSSSGIAWCCSSVRRPLALARSALCSRSLTAAGQQRRRPSGLFSTHLFARTARHLGPVPGAVSVRLGVGLCCPPSSHRSSQESPRPTRLFIFLKCELGGGGPGLALTGSDCTVQWPPIALHRVCKHETPRTYGTAARKQLWQETPSVCPRGFRYICYALLAAVEVMLLYVPVQQSRPSGGARSFVLEQKEGPGAPARQQWYRTTANLPRSCDARPYLVGAKHV